MSTEPAIYPGYRFPAEVIHQAIWLYHLFSLSLRDIALSLGLAACQKGFSVTFITAAGLVHQLMEARDEKRLLRLQRELQAPRLRGVSGLSLVRRAFSAAAVSRSAWSSSRSPISISSWPISAASRSEDLP